MSWTPERIEHLKALWDEGRSGSEIARVLHISRGAVLGKIFRLKLPKRGKEVSVNNVRRLTPTGRPQAQRPRAPKPRRPKAAPTNNLAAVNAVRRAEGKAGKHYADVRPLIVDATLAKPWTERRFGECAYPISGEGGDTFSCCAPAQPHGYCKAHAQRMFHVPKESAKNLQRLARRYA